MINSQQHKQLSFQFWLPILFVAAAWRGIILASGAVSFHSDEAVVGLMGRHILQGQSIPTFFYGQGYMGSLDPLLVSFAFRLFGESVLSIRLVQSFLFLLTVATAMLLTWRITNSDGIAAVAGLLIALPSPLVSLYTTISLGGYGETLLISNLLLLVSHEIATERDRYWHWLVLGALAGLGWWTNNLIIVYALPSGLCLLFSKNVTWKGLALATLAFLIGSAPWWLYNLNNDWQSVKFLLGGFENTQVGVSISVVDRLIGFLLLGIPAVTGLRYSWSMTTWAGAWSIIVIVAYTLLLLRTFGKPATKLFWLMLGSIAVVFVLSSFGVDATGRYLLPMTIPLSILAAIGASSLPRWFALIVISAFIGTNVVGTALALKNSPPGLTPQFDPATDFTNQYDQEVIEFLQANNGQYGYATYWITYRLAFLSKESIILSPQLPYKSTLIYTPIDRYPRYTALVEQAERPVFVTANLPQLDEIITERLKREEITFKQHQIGPYTIFYDLSRRITPVELGLHSLAEP